MSDDKATNATSGPANGAGPRRTPPAGPTGSTAGSNSAGSSSGSSSKPSKGSSKGSSKPADTKSTSSTDKKSGNGALAHSKTSGLWVFVVGMGIVLTLLIILILQNTQRVEVSFLGWTGNPPLSGALLIAAAAGILLTSIAGTLRIMQIRRRVKKG